jgi:hypothetical protein
MEKQQGRWPVTDTPEANAAEANAGWLVLQSSTSGLRDAF